MKLDTYNKLRDDVKYYLSDHQGYENVEWLETDKETLRYPNSPTYDIYAGDINVQATYWKDYENLRGTMKRYKVEDRSTTFTVNYNNANDDRITRHIKLYFNDDKELNMFVITKVNGYQVATYTKTIHEYALEKDNWNNYGNGMTSKNGGSAGARYHFIWELFK